MASLSEEVQEFIVQGHACYRKPSLIVRDVQEEFGVTVSREQVLFYHPERGGKTKRLGQRWKDLFRETREAFLGSKVQVGIANQNYRLMALQRMAERAEERGNLVLAKDLMEQAAKEVGGAYTNRREHSGPGGGAIPVDFGNRKKELAARMLKKLLERGRSEGEARASLLAMGVDERDLPAIPGA
jgi:hypothetical protein